MTGTNKSLRQNLTKEMLAEVETIYNTLSDSVSKLMPVSKLPLALKALGMSMNELDESVQLQEINLDLFIELVLTCMKRPNWAANEMNETFGLYDKDSNGYIDPAELRRVFVKLGENVLETELADQLREFDIDGDFQVRAFPAELHYCCVFADTLHRLTTRMLSFLNQMAVAEYYKMVSETRGTDYIFDDNAV